MSPVSSPDPEAKQQLSKATDAYEAGENPRVQQVWRSKAEEVVQGSELSFPSPCSEDSKTPVEHQRGWQQVKVPTFPTSQKNLCSSSVAELFFFFFLSQYKETVYLERSRNQKHREMVFLLGRQQSMPGLAGVFLQRCGQCSELDAASLPAAMASPRAISSFQE